jgi:antirestriction protein
VQTKKPLKKRQSKKKNIVAANLARAIWRTKGFCEDCSRTKLDGWQMQGAHVYGTGAYPKLCSDIRNGMCLCSACHRKWTNNPEWRTFVLDSRVAKYYEPLHRLNNQHTKVDWVERIDFLKEILRAINEGEMTVEAACEYETEY